MSYDAVMLDVYGVLLENTDGSGAPNPVQVALEVSEEEYRQARELFDDDHIGGFEVGLGAHSRMGGILARLGRKPPQGDIEGLVNAEIAWYMDRTRLIDGALAVIDEIKGMDLRVGLCSNCTPYGLIIMQSFGLMHKVDGRAALSHLVHARKPDKRMYAAGVNELKTVPSRTIFFDNNGDGALKGAWDFNRSMLIVRVEDPQFPPEPGDPDFPAIGSIRELPAFLHSLPD